MKIKKSKSRIIFEIFNAAFMLLLMGAMLFPFLNVASVSLMPIDEYLKKRNRSDPPVKLLLNPINSFLTPTPFLMPIWLQFLLQR